jgi:hypothetical protein
LFSGATNLFSDAKNVTPVRLSLLDKCWHSVHSYVNMEVSNC